MPVTHQIIRHIVQEDFEALEYGRDPTSWPRHLSTKARISRGSARNLLDANKGPPRKASDPVLDEVARHFSALPHYEE